MLIGTYYARARLGSMHMHGHIEIATWGVVAFLVLAV
jgi:hypothetical protein